MDELLAEIARFDAQNNYLKTLALLRALKAGTIGLYQVALTADGWTVSAGSVPKATDPPLPELKVADT